MKIYKELIYEDIGITNEAMNNKIKDDRVYQIKLGSAGRSLNLNSELIKIFLKTYFNYDIIEMRRILEENFNAFILNQRYILFTKEDADRVIEWLESIRVMNKLDEN